MGLYRLLIWLFKTVYNRVIICLYEKEANPKPVYFIATKHKNSPAKVAFYTKDGGQVPEDKVEKEPTKSGVRLYTFAY